MRLNTETYQPRGYYREYWDHEGYVEIGHSHPVFASLFARHTRPGWKCLDVGCGDGQTSGRWLHGNGRAYTGVDISDTAVEHARGLGLDAITVDDASSLPFPDETFDAVVCIEVLEHLFRPELAVGEIIRVLKSGGVFISTVPNVAYYRRRIELTLLGRWNPVGDDLSVEQPWRDPHIRFFNPRTFHRMLSWAGFEDIDIRGFEGSFIKNAPIVGRLYRKGGSPLYQNLEARYPGFFGRRLSAVARKPLSGSGESS
jgi:SAM-dependent methyltransferase